MMIIIMMTIIITKIVGKWRKLHDGNVYALCLAPNIIRSFFILVINQLDAQTFVLQLVYFMPLHVSGTMCSSSGRQNCIIQPLVSSH